MGAPINGFLKKYALGSAVRMHMPGHKGKGDIERLDITEISGADSLFEADGIIAESERLTGEIFGADTFYSTEGSSLSIRAMLYLASLYAKEQGAEPLILAGRNAHRSFLSAAALIGFSVEWLTAKNGTYLSCPVSASEVAEKIDSLENKPTAVYLTSPDYLGGTVDIEAISAVCRNRGVLFLVDNAHGAYLKFLTPSRHPIDLGADMCADSAHKTLHALTGGGYLHISKNLPVFFKENAKNAMAHFASTSPSYLILASLDALTETLTGDFSAKLQSIVCKIGKLKRELVDFGYTVLDGEPLKITIFSKPFGYLGTELSARLSERGIIAEFSDCDFLVLMPSADTADEDISRLSEALFSIKSRTPIISEPPYPHLPKKRLTPREAFLTPSEKIPTEKSLGRTLAEASVGCPPAVPILVSGELIDESAIEALKYYGIKTVKAVKE